MPNELPAVFRLVLGLYARRLGLTFEQFEAYATGREPWPPGMLDAILETFEPLGLPSKSENNTLNTVDTSLEIAPARMGRPMKQRKHPFVAALLKKGLSVGEVAKDLGRAKSTVQSWYKPPGDPGLRPIPRDAANALRKRFGVPLSAWTRIAD